MPARKPEGLPKPTVVAYLAAHVEWLTKKGIFPKRYLAARIVFLHLCCHPDANAVPGPDRQSTWTCPVDPPHHMPDEIATATGLDQTNVRRALKWLDAEGLIRVDWQDKGKHKGHGPVTITSTHRLSDWRRTYVSPANGHSAQVHVLSPANGHSAQNIGTAPKFEALTVPERARRTVAARRPPA